MKRQQEKTQYDREMQTSESAEGIDEWLRYELQGLHRNVLDESLPDPIQDLLQQLEVSLRSAPGCATGDRGKDK